MGRLVDLSRSRRVPSRNSAYVTASSCFRSHLMSTGVERARGLDREGIRTARVRWNLSAAALYEEAVRRQEGLIAAEGPLVCRTGLPTGRSPTDQFVARGASSEQHIAWGKVNNPMAPAQFDALHRDPLTRLEGMFFNEPAATVIGGHRIVHLAPG